MCDEYNGSHLVTARCSSNTSCRWTPSCRSPRWRGSSRRCWSKTSSRARAGSSQTEAASRATQHDQNGNWTGKILCVYLTTKFAVRCRLINYVPTNFWVKPGELNWLDNILSWAVAAEIFLVIPNVARILWVLQKILVISWNMKTWCQAINLTSDKSFKRF